METIPGIGPIIALVLAATVTSPSAFSSGRQFAAWLGLVPRQNLKDGRPGNTTPADCRSSRGLALGQNNGSDEHYAHNPKRAGYSDLRLDRFVPSKLEKRSDPLFQ
ncbi:transposase [Mesorhizobium australicum]|uniref:transposase n=1 Tax=Mesorhizobium australicum TaxID=536018 RepID=UPI0033383B2D